MSGDLDGQDAFDRLLEVALDSRVVVREATDARDRAQQAQRETERLAAQRLDDVNRLVRENAEALPKLKELWETARALRDLWIRTVVNDGPEVARLSAALAASSDLCDQPPF